MPEIVIPFDDRLAGPYTAIAGQTEFDYDFYVAAADDLAVTRRRAGLEAPLVPPGQMGAEYSVTGVGNQAGGKVVLTAGSLAGDIIAIHGAEKVERIGDFQPPPNSPSSTDFNTELDRIAILLQEINTRALRSIHLRPTDAADDMALPVKADRQDGGAGSIAGYDSNGKPAVFAKASLGIGATLPTGDVAGKFAMFGASSSELVADDLQVVLRAQVFG